MGPFWKSSPVPSAAGQVGVNCLPPDHARSLPYEAIILGVEGKLESTHSTAAQARDIEDMRRLPVARCLEAFVVAHSHTVRCTNWILAFRLEQAPSISLLSSAYHVTLPDSQPVSTIHLQPSFVFSNRHPPNVLRPTTTPIAVALSQTAVLVVVHCCSSSLPQAPPFRKPFI